MRLQLLKTERFSRRISNVPAEIWQKIAGIDELKGRWNGEARINPQLLKRLKKSVLVTSSGASTRIEGARLTDEEVERLMMGVKTTLLADRDSQEVKGYYELLQNIFTTWTDLRFTENTIKHFHNELLRYVEKDQRHRGDYKKIENTVEMFNAERKSIGVIFETTKAYLTPKEMQELVAWTQKALEAKQHHPLLIIGNFIVEFLKIHPFQDGNGRLSRILVNFLLLKAGYLYMPYISHEKLVEDNKHDYYLALRKSQKTFISKKDDITAWLKFFLGLLLKQAEAAIMVIESEALEKVLSLKQLAVWNYIQGVAEAGPGEITENTGVVRPTVNQALNKLLKFNRIERLGMGRSVRYRKL